MLSAIHHGRVANCTLGQEDIVHIESTVESIAEAGNRFVIFPISAAYEYSVACFNSLEGLEEIDWPLFFERPLVGDFAKYFFSRLDPPRHARREDTRKAEFLVHCAMPLTLASRIGVATEEKGAEVANILARNGVKLPVTTQPDWYFGGQ